MSHFAKAGFTERGSDGMLVNAEGQRLSFTVSTGYQTMKDVLTILKEAAAKAGLEFRVEVLDGTAGWKKVQEKQHDIHFAAFGVFLEMYPRFWEHYHSDNAYDDAFLDDGSINPERKIKTQTNNLETFAVFEVDGLIERYRASPDTDEMIAIANADGRASCTITRPMCPASTNRFIAWATGAGFAIRRFFNHKHSSSAGQLFVHWIDEDMKQETLDALKAGKTFEPQIRYYDQWQE